MSPLSVEGRIKIDSGIGNTIDTDTISFSNRVLITVFSSIAIYSTIELVVLILSTFRRRSGLYFWSLIVATGGTCIYSVSWILHDYGLVKIREITTVMMVASWNCMVTGESLVLYSRLHLLYAHQSNLRPLLAMIITTAIVVYVPGWVIIVGANTSRPPLAFLYAYSLFEKIEIMIFTIQEMILTGYYLVSCYRFWTADNLRTSTKIRGMIIHLMIVNLIVIAFDTSLIYLEWEGNYLMQTAYKGFVYSVKLKIEISILTNLVELVKEARSIESQQNTTRQLQEEWTDTLDRTVGAGHRTESTNDRSDAAILTPPEEPSCEKTKVQTPDRVLRPPARVLSWKTTNLPPRVMPQFDRELP
ncbi:hypothetical protein HD806DRAFT_332903 [Xylariaceae sp. AK1471]|nr:hypothetical protein HD806DRAFT_332903 [Xylariaceae sp. AK1471]